MPFIRFTSFMSFVSSSMSYRDMLRHSKVSARRRTWIFVAGRNRGGAADDGADAAVTAAVFKIAVGASGFVVDEILVVRKEAQRVVIRRQPLRSLGILGVGDGATRSRWRGVVGGGG